MDNNGNIVNTSANFTVAGRVEIRKNGIWGTICNDNLHTDLYSVTQTVNDNVAKVVCRHLGYSGGKLLSLNDVPDGEHQIWLDDLSCSGNESHL